MTVSGKGKVAGIMGWPVSHSRSPRLHSYWLDHYGIDGAYIPLPVRPEHLGQALRALPLLGIHGVNLTIPHKEAALAYLDVVDKTAALIGAVNTVVVSESGRLLGSNTDVVGFRESLNATGLRLRVERPAVVLGAGGAARAVVVALGDIGFKTVTVINRTRSRAEQMCVSLTLLPGTRHVVGWDDRHKALEGAALLVNTTSLGMIGEPPLDIEVGALPPDAVVTDIVYAPLKTPLLARAEDRGLAVVDGLGMLLHQARAGFRAWFGQDPAVTPALRAFVLDGLV